MIKVEWLEGSYYRPVLRCDWCGDVIGSGDDGARYEGLAREDGTPDTGQIFHSHAVCSRTRIREACREALRWVDGPLSEALALRQVEV